MPKFQITVPLREGDEATIDVEAIKGTDHLVIHRTVSRGYPPLPEHAWSVTHRPSGEVMLQARRKATAQGAAEYLAALDEKGGLGLGRDKEALLADKPTVKILLDVRGRAARWDRLRTDVRGRPPVSWWEA